MFLPEIFDESTECLGDLSFGRNVSRLVPVSLICFYFTLAPVKILTF